MTTVPRRFQVPVPAAASSPGTGKSAAIIAATAALIGSLIGAFGAAAPSVINTQKQIDSAATEARQSFLRPQQRTAYAAFLSDLGALLNAESTAEGSLSSTVNLPPDSRRMLVSNIITAFDKLSASYADVQLLGSTSTNAIAEKTVDDSSKTYFALRKQAETTPGTPFVDDDGTVHYGVEVIGQNMGELTDAMRRDLGTF